RRRQRRCRARLPHRRFRRTHQRRHRLPGRSPAQIGLTIGPTETRMSTVTPLPSRPDPVVRARELGPAIEAAANEIERSMEIPEPLISRLHESRLFRMLLPRSVGGDQLEPWIYLAAVEEIARHDGSVGWNLFVANSSALIAPFISEE